VPAVLALRGVVSPVAQAGVGVAVYALAAYAFGAVHRREIQLALRG
jgi:hypothetical protein